MRAPALPAVGRGTWGPARTAAPVTTMAGPGTSASAARLPLLPTCSSPARAFARIDGQHAGWAPGSRRLLGTTPRRPVVSDPIVRNDRLGADPRASTAPAEHLRRRDRDRSGDSAADRAALGRGLRWRPRHPDRAHLAVLRLDRLRSLVDVHPGAGPGWVGRPRGGCDSCAPVRIRPPPSPPSLPELASSRAESRLPRSERCLTHERAYRGRSRGSRFAGTTRRRFVTPML